MHLLAMILVLLVDDKLPSWTQPSTIHIFSSDVDNSHDLVGYGFGGIYPHVLWPSTCLTVLEGIMKVQQNYVAVINIHNSASA